jgi:hypothetical protein
MAHHQLLSIKQQLSRVSTENTTIVEVETQPELHLVSMKAPHPTSGLMGVKIVLTDLRRWIPYPQKLNSLDYMLVPEHSL